MKPKDHHALLSGSVYFLESTTLLNISQLSDVNTFNSNDHHSPPPDLGLTGFDLGSKLIASPPAISLTVSCVNADSSGSDVGSKNIFAINSTQWGSIFIKQFNGVLASSCQW
jgi:hypothetical protein